MIFDNDLSFNLCVVSTILENISNTVSLNLLYRGLVILLDWLLFRLAPDRLITAFILF